MAPDMYLDKPRQRVHVHGCGDHSLVQLPPHLLLVIVPRRDPENPFSLQPPLVVEPCLEQQDDGGHAVAVAVDRALHIVQIHSEHALTAGGR